MNIFSKNTLSPGVVFGEGLVCYAVVYGAAPGDDNGCLGHFRGPPYISAVHQTMIIS